MNIQNIDFKIKQQIETSRGMFFIYGDGECFQRVNKKGQTHGAVLTKNAISVMGKKNDSVELVATKF